MERPVRPIEIVKLFPLVEFLAEIHIIGIRQELIKFFPIGAMGALDFAIEFR